MRTKIAEYDNGNVHVTRFSDGTVIRFSKDDEFNFAFPENMDIKLTNKCTGTNCAWCHEGSGPNGCHGDIMNASWVDTIHPFTEAALGGGNILEHPDLIPFLKKLKDKNIYANITLNQKHFMQNLDILQVLSNMGWIHGIGVSFVKATDDFFKAIEKFPNAVIHVIAGILTFRELGQLLKHHNLKILILGYKHLRRGEEYYQLNKIKAEQSIDQRIEMLEYMMPQMFEAFQVVSFDCLAIEQLHVKNHLPKQIWDEFYQGDDGTMTFYIDMVNNQFAKSSTEPLENRIEIDNKTVDDMFKIVRGIQ